MPVTELAGNLADMVARLRLPVVVAPMTGVSNWELTAATVKSGVAASFPTHNCADTAELHDWLQRITAVAGSDAAVIPNLVVHRSNSRLAADLDVLIEHRVPAVITSVGSPAGVIDVLHGAGIAVISDVASLRHARRAIDAGADGLVLLCSGAGGQTGWANPFAFVRAIREMWDGVVILAGGINDGAGLLAAVALGCDLGYMGTRFIATTESAATPAYHDALIGAELDDIETTTALTGLSTNLIRSPELTEQAPPTYNADALPALNVAAANTEVFSAGHGVTAVKKVISASELIDRLDGEIRAAAKAVGLGCADIDPDPDEYFPWAPYPPWGRLS